MSEQPRSQPEMTANFPTSVARPLSDFAFERVGDDLVILDGETLQYHTLNYVAAWIWQSCNGVTTPARMAQDLNIPVEIIESTIVDLDQAGLLQAPSGRWDLTLSRRRATKLLAAGLVGAVGLPVIKSITAPDAAAAASIGQCAFGFVAGNWLCGVCSFFGCGCEGVTGMDGVCCVCGGGNFVSAASAISPAAFWAAVDQASQGLPITGYDEPVSIEAEPEEVEQVDETTDTQTSTDDTSAPAETEIQAPETEAIDPPVEPPTESAPPSDEQQVSSGDSQEPVETSEDTEQSSEAAG